MLGRQGDDCEVKIRSSEAGWKRKGKVNCNILHRLRIETNVKEDEYITAWRVCMDQAVQRSKRTRRRWNSMEKGDTSLL